MTFERNLKQELLYSFYIDMEYGKDCETLDYECLIKLLNEILSRIEALEKELEYQKEYAMEQNERYS